MSFNLQFTSWRRAGTARCTSELRRISSSGFGSIKTSFSEGFTAKYDVKLLVYYELHKTMDEAIRREKAVKEWKRAWKIRLIEEGNPLWTDLWNEVSRQ
jgi:putative endonuclease